MVKELDEEKLKVANALKEQQKMKTVLEQKTIELKKNLLLNEELTDKLERLRQERDNVMAERNKLAMDQQALVADKEVRTLIGMFLRHENFTKSSITAYICLQGC